MKKIETGAPPVAQNRLGLAIQSEEEVMAEYRRLGYVKDRKEEQVLSAFFSSNRAPTGLTESQVRTCIQKFPLREWYRYQTVDARGFMHDINRVGRSLPSELTSSEPMTEERFKAGMDKFNAAVAAILAQEIIYGHGKFLYTDEMYAQLLINAVTQHKEKD